jgi:transposase-like protein
MSKTAMNLVTLVETFHSEDHCRAYLETLRWPSGIECPRCSSANVSRVKGRSQLVCNGCDYHFSVTSGTVMHDTHLPLWKWFLAAYSMCEAKKGVSANQLKRTLGVSYQTAWHLSHRIRAAMGSVEQAPLSGTVEVDETFIGGKVRGMGHGYRGNKAIVAGAVERGGDIRLDVVGDTTRRTLHRFIREHTDPETEAIYTDELPSYRGIGDHDTRHEAVNHSAKEYVRGDVHTNTVESAWSLFKRGVIGSYHKLSAKHLEAYLAEFAWRYNNRGNPRLFHDTMVRLLSAEPLPYSALVAE